jgi:hypothetical protein
MPKDAGSIPATSTTRSSQIEGHFFAECARTLIALGAAPSNRETYCHLVTVSSRWPGASPPRAATCRSNRAPALAEFKAQLYRALNELRKVGLTSEADRIERGLRR